MASQLDNPSTWATGGDAPTEKQTAFLQTLAAEKGVEVGPRYPSSLYLPLLTHAQTPPP